MTLEELARADNQNHCRERFPLWPPAMFFVGSALCFLVLPLAGFGAETLQDPDPETVRVYQENGMEPPGPEYRWDDGAFNDKGRLLVAVGAGAAALGLLWLALRLVRRTMIMNGEPLLIQWVRNEPSAIARVEATDTTYSDQRGRTLLHARGVVVFRHDGRTAAIYAVDPNGARAFIAARCLPASG